MTNTHSIERNKNKNEYNETFTNRWTNQTTQSNSETISEMLYELSTKQLNRIIICSTVHIQQQHAGIHENLVISDKIQQKYANKWWNDQIKKIQWNDNSIK